jgi:cell division protein FtsI/penicillin-binding protein 2
MFSDKDTIDTLEEENNLILKQKTNQILELTNFLPMDNNKFSNIVSLYLINLIYKDSLKSDYINKIKIQKNRIFTSKFPPKISIGDFSIK